MKQSDIDRLSSMKDATGENIKYGKNHGRPMMTFNSERNGVVSTHNFRTQYMNANGSEIAKDPNGRAVNCSEFSPEELHALAHGDVVKMKYTTTSQVDREEIVVLSKQTNNYGKEAIRPANATKDVPESNRIFNDNVYDAAKTKALDMQSSISANQVNKDAINKVLNTAKAFETPESHSNEVSLETK